MLSGSPIAIQPRPALGRANLSAAPSSVRRRLFRCANGRAGPAPVVVIRARGRRAWALRPQDARDGLGGQPRHLLGIAAVVPRLVEHGGDDLAELCGLTDESSHGPLLVGGRRSI